MILQPSKSAYRLLLLPLLFASLILLSRSSWFMEAPHTLSLAISADLLLTIPLIYFLLIRTTRIPKITVVPVTIAGLITGFFILPQNHHDYLIGFRDFVLPVIELSVMGYLVYQVTLTLRKFRINNTTGDFYTALRKTIRSKLSGFAAEAVTMEIAVLYYGILAWKRKPCREHEFTYHRDSGGGVIWIFILFLVITETVVFHLLLMNWSIVAAWIFSGWSIYSALQVLGIFKATFRRPYVLTRDRLILHYGIMNEIDIPLQHIDSIRLYTSSFSNDESILALSPLSELENQNILMTLKEPVSMRGLYGFRKEVSRLKFHVDQPDHFLACVEERMISGFSGH